MLYQIMDGTVSAGGVPILSHIDFEIRGTEKIAVAGKNGAGKTTLLRLLAGEISLDRDDKRNGPGIMASRRLTVGMMRQQPFGDTSCTVEEELLKGCPGREVAGKNGTGLSSSAIFSEWDRERFDYEREYDILFTGFGFSKEDKKKKLSEFSGGEQTKIALIRLLLEKPDILLMNNELLTKTRAAARRAGFYERSVDGFGRTVEKYNGIPMMDVGQYYNGTKTVDVIETTTPSATAYGETAIYAAKLGLNAFHGISVDGSKMVHTYLPDLNAPGAVKKGEVEMLAGAVLKNSKMAGVLKGIKVKPKTAG